VTSVQCGDKHFQLAAEADFQSKPLHVIPVTFTASDSSGKVVETIHITTDLGDVSPALFAYAVVAP
jgi:hypothetical protein